MNRWLIIGLAAGALFWLACVAIVVALCRIAAEADELEACATDRRNGRSARPSAPAPLSAVEKRLDINQGWDREEVDMHWSNG